MKFASENDSWIRLIALYVVISQAGVGILAAMRAEPSGAYFLLNHFIFLALVGLWLDADNRRNRVMQIWDLGFFHYLAWPIVLPYYLVKSRGFRRAVKIMLGWVTLFYGVAMLVFTVIYVSLQGRK